MAGSGIAQHSFFFKPEGVTFVGVEVCSTCTVGTPYKGKGLSARANRIGKCFFMKKVSKYHLFG